MKVWIEYVTSHTVEVDITPEEYCVLNTNTDYGNYFPEFSYNRNLVIDDDGEEELYNWMLKREGKL